MTESKSNIINEKMFEHDFIRVRKRVRMKQSAKVVYTFNGCFFSLFFEGVFRIVSRLSQFCFVSSMQIQSIIEALIIK